MQKVKTILVERDDLVARGMLGFFEDAGYPSPERLRGNGSKGFDGEELDGVVLAQLSSFLPSRPLIGPGIKGCPQG